MITKFKIDRMKKNLARSVPDAVWRDFNPIVSSHREIGVNYNQWCDWFTRMMRVKHGDNFSGVNAFQSDYHPVPGTVRVQLNVKLKDNTR